MPLWALRPQLRLQVQVSGPDPHQRHSATGISAEDVAGNRALQVGAVICTNVVNNIHYRRRAQDSDYFQANSSHQWCIGNWSLWVVYEVSGASGHWLVAAAL